MFPALVNYRKRWRRREARCSATLTFGSGASLGFGDSHAQLFILGLFCPAAQCRNRTGRVSPAIALGMFYTRRFTRRDSRSQPISLHARWIAIEGCLPRRLCVRASRNKPLPQRNSSLLRVISSVTGNSASPCRAWRSGKFALGCVPGTFENNLAIASRAA